MPATLPAPLPPFLPESPEAFTAHVATHSPDWFEYCRKAYEYINHAETALAEAQEKVLQASLRVTPLEKEIDYLKHEIKLERVRDEAIRGYQDEQLQKLTLRLANALKERDKAISLATPTIDTPVFRPAPDLLAGKDTTSTPAPEPSRISERLPDPEKFEGDRKDLRRFISQIHEKMKVNRDRFPTTQSRMAYVTNRLKGPPYAQILPYIKDGECQLSDYDEVLRILDRAFGDPNRVNNARSDLFRLRQNNKDFSLFFAEFQRLALEGEMSEDALSVLLEQAISRELRAMLMHHEPPNRQYPEFANFLQDLENRRHYYENTPAPVSKTYSAVPKTRPAPASPAVPAIATPTPTIAKQRDPDAMDLGNQRRRPTSPTTRRDRGECFRCGSSTHLVRDCPMPDTRGLRIVSPSGGSQRSTSTRSPSPDPSPSVNGVSLG